MNGSNIFFRVGNIYRSKAIKKPNNVLNVKEIITSNEVVIIWGNRLLVLYNSINVFNILRGMKI